jgi:pimeloyl-ACP methyl ester carboxylesterase
MAASFRLDRGEGIELSWTSLPGKTPTIVFLPGFKSDMNGSKALDLAEFCTGRGQAMLRLDYSGHGESGGRFEDGTIGRWTQDALEVIDQSVGDLILVGSSMGGWIALLVALARPDRVAGLVGIAAAPDFTERLMWQAMTPAERATLQRDGVLQVPSQYGDAYPVTLRLIEEGREHLLLGAPIELSCPVRLLHGQQDPDVPWELALTTAAAITGADVQVTLVKDGDHRLSRPEDLALLRRILSPLFGQNRP